MQVSLDNTFLTPFKKKITHAWKDLIAKMAAINAVGVCKSAGRDGFVQHFLFARLGRDAP